MKQLLITLLAVFMVLSASAKKVTRNFYVNSRLNAEQVEDRANSLKGVYNAIYRRSTRQLFVTYNDRVTSLSRIKTSVNSYNYNEQGRNNNKPVVNGNRNNNNNKPVVNNKNNKPNNNNVAKKPQQNNNKPANNNNKKPATNNKQNTNNKPATNNKQNNKPANNKNNNNKQNSNSSSWRK